LIELLSGTQTPKLLKAENKKREGKQTWNYNNHAMNKTHIMSQHRKSTNQICNTQSNNTHCKHNLSKNIIVNLNLLAQHYWSMISY